MGSSITIRDVAKAAGVSVASVSRVISGSGKTSEETKTKVNDAIKTLKYIPNTSARTMASHKSNMIGLVVDTPSTPYMSEMIGYIESALGSTDFDLILCGAYYDQNREERLINSLIARQVDGLIILTGRSDYSESIRELLLRVPTVMIGKFVSFDNHPVVTTDYRLGGMIGTRYLLELGHRHIAFLGKRNVSNAQILRAEGYAEICSQWGVEPVFWDNPDKENSIYKGYTMTKACLEAHKDLTAIFAASDSVAVGVIKAADELGIRIPDDLSVLGFDNTFLASTPRINLTTIDQPKQMMADLAVQILIDSIHNPDQKTESRLLTPTLVKRETCGLCPSK